MDVITQALERLNEVAFGDLEAAPDLAGTVLAKHRQRRRRTAAITGVAGVAVVAAAAAVAVQATGENGSSVTIGNRTGGAPCADPPASVHNAMLWPCPQQTPNSFFAAIFDKPDFYLTPGAPHPLEHRILAFGPLPNSRPGSAVVVGEFWPAKNAESASLFVAYASPGKDQIGIARPEEPSGPNGPVPQMEGSGEISASDRAMILISPPRLPGPPAATTCSELAQSKPQRNRGYLAACSDAVVVRSDITSVQVVHDGAEVGSPIAVTDGLAGLAGPQEQRPGWRIEGLDSSGAVVQTIPWQPTA
ncbi:MAG TPA: hypothetical protein VHW74_01610 [Mycobacteriales bacterium]|jgi:hypothetical protein|nr:hypothetical protein [Mycobacteriales bacterium]